MGHMGSAGLGSSCCSLTCCHESSAEGIGEGKKVCGHSFMLLASVLQGEPGLEGDSGPPGPDGIKVRCAIQRVCSRQGILVQCALVSDPLTSLMG